MFLIFCETYRNGHAVVYANSCVSIAILQTRYALPIIGWIADVKWFTFVTLSSLGVVVAFQALIEPIGASAITVTIALALNRTVSTYVSKIAMTHIRLYANSLDATRCALWHAFVPKSANL